MVAPVVFYVIQRHRADVAAEPSPDERSAREAEMNRLRRGARTGASDPAGARGDPRASARGAEADPERDPEASRDDGAARAAVANAARIPARPAAVEVPIPGFERPAGMVDQGPGPYAELYNGRSGRLAPTNNPHGTEVTTRAHSPNGMPFVTAWVPSIRVIAGQEVVIRANVTGEAGVAVVPDTIGVNVVRHGDPSSGFSSPMVAAAAGSQSQYEYRFTPPAAAATGAASPPTNYDFVVQANGTLNGEAFERAVPGGFQVHSPGGTLDSSHAQIQRQAGDLTVTLPVMITRGGTFWAYAELYGGADGSHAVAFARDRFENVVPGMQTFTLTFGGLVIRDSEVDGPYIVRNVRLLQVDTIPPQETDPILQLAPTPAWHASEFH